LLGTFRRRQRRGERFYNLNQQMLGRGSGISVLQIKFFPAIEAYLVRPPLDGEDAAHVTVMTTEYELKNPA
jgi:hypothetical protein